MDTVEELRAAADLISARARHVASPGSDAALQRLSDAAEAVGQAWCGSWLPGCTHHYLSSLEAGADGGGSCVAWSVEAIHQAIHERAGRPDTQLLLADAMQAAQLFERARCDALALMVVAACERVNDPVLGALLKEASQLRQTRPEMLVECCRPRAEELGEQRLPAAAHEVPPHFAELGAIDVLRSPRAALNALIDLLQRASDHLAAQQAARDDALPLTPPWAGRPDAVHERLPGHAPN